jgi:hypothetical protein
MKNTSSIWYMIKTKNGVIGQLYGSYYNANFYRRLCNEGKNFKIVKVKITEIKKKKKRKIA